MMSGERRREAKMAAGMITGIPDGVGHALVMTKQVVS